MEAHAMSLIRSGYAVSRRSRLLGVLFSALFALALFHPSVAAAQEVKQIKLTEKHLQGLIAVSEDMAKLSDGANQDKLDAELEAQAETLVKRNGFANLAEFDDASSNISMIMSGIDQQTKKFRSGQTGCGAGSSGRDSCQEKRFCEPRRVRRRVV